MQNAYATYVKEYYLGTFGVSIETYNQQHLKRTNSAGDTSDRLWWFQVCTEVAFFQVAPSDDSMRSSEINTKCVFAPLYVFHSFYLPNFFFILLKCYGMIICEL